MSGFNLIEGNGIADQPCATDQIVNNVSVPKKLLYIHVAKTAGTSLNNLLLQHYPDDKGITHIESKPFWLDPARAKDLLSFDFISGHVSLPAFRKRVTDRGYFVISTFRNPLEHIASHLVWVKNMRSPGKEEFLAGHPAWVQNIANKLWDIDFSSNEAIAAFFDSMTDLEAALFDNYQTRYLLNIPGKQRVSQNELSSALNTLDMIDLVGTTERYDEFIALLAITMNWSLQYHSEKLNKAQSRFGIDIASEGFKRAVERVIWADRMIYDMAVKRMNQQVNKRIFGIQEDNKSLASIRQHLGEIQGCLDTVKPGRVSGWVMYKKRPDVPIAIRVSSVKTGRSWIGFANQFRDDIRRLGLHPSGKCGFIFAFKENEALEPGDEIIVSVMWSDNVWRRFVG